MNKDMAKGKAKQVRGEAKEAAGKAKDDKPMEIKWKTEQVAEENCRRGTAR